VTTPETFPPPRDEVLDALDALCEALADRTAIDAALRRADTLRARRLEGQSYRDIVSEQEQRPLLVELLTHRLERLAEVSARFRRAEALALHDEGMTMDQIAEAFGVTRQRVSAILREARAQRAGD
jgi:DNA-directed RNA polymerase sigma subunit (sigma70/sigma32)